MLPAISPTRFPPPLIVTTGSSDHLQFFRPDVGGLPKFLIREVSAGEMIVKLPYFGPSGESYPVIAHAESMSPFLSIYSIKEAVDASSRLVSPDDGLNLLDGSVPISVYDPSKPNQNPHCVARLKGHTSGVNAVVLVDYDQSEHDERGGGGLLVSGSEDARLLAWDLRNGISVDDKSSPSIEAVYCMKSCGEMKRTVCVGRSGGTLEVWDVKNELRLRRSVSVRAAGAEDINCLDVGTMNESHLTCVVTGGDHINVLPLDGESSSIIAQWSVGQGLTAWSVFFPRDVHQPLVYVGASGGPIECRDLRKPETALMQKNDLHQSVPTSMRSLGRNVFCSVELEGAVLIWDQNLKLYEGVHPMHAGTAASGLCCLYPIIQEEQTGSVGDRIWKEERIAFLMEGFLTFEIIGLCEDGGERIKTISSFLFV